MKNPNKTTQRRKANTLPSVNTFFTSETTTLTSLFCTTYMTKKIYIFYWFFKQMYWYLDTFYYIKFEKYLFTFHFEKLNIFILL